MFEQTLFGQPLASSTEDIIIYDNNFADEIYNKFVDESTGIDIFAEMERDEETYLNELQGITHKIDLPIDEYVALFPNADVIIEETLNDTTLKDEQLLMEFNSILENVELQNQLTPPQTPPYMPVLQDDKPQHIPIIDQYQIFESNDNYQQVVQQQQSIDESQFIFIQQPVQQSDTSEHDITAILYDNSNDASMLSNDEMILDAESIISSPINIEREIEVVNELVQAHTCQNSIYEDTSSSISSWSPRSEYSSASSQYDYEPVAKKSSSGLRGVTKKRSRGYGRNPEEKKSRKKEQNKNAATRYRIKKKHEVEIIMDEEKILMDRNRKLTTSYKDTKREVKYLKSLLRDLFKARDRKSVV